MSQRWIDLSDFLKKIKNRKSRAPEKNIFSIGGRGYYENPTTDLLGFYLDPGEEHNLENLVLSSLLECIPGFEVVAPGLVEPPEREYLTKDYNRIDLILNGEDWCIILENKIWHASVNPFKEYQSSIEKNARFSRKRKIFGILAPRNPKIEGWQWISYANLIDKIRRNLDQHLNANDASKWSIFLQDLLLNLDEHIGKSMNIDDFEFTRKNYPEIVASISLHDRYLEEIGRQASDASARVFGSAPSAVKRQNWSSHGIALRVFPAQGRKHNATLLVCPDGNFRVQLYVENRFRKSGIEKSNFLSAGPFVDYGDEVGGSLWVFAKNESELDGAIRTLETALKLLREEVEW